MIAAILLAAGRSRRMGAFKPLLPFGDRTVIEACLDYLEEGGVDYAVVVTGHRSADVRMRLRDRAVTFATNDDPESEMGVSIGRGVAKVPREASAVFIALTDQPAIPPEVVRSLLESRARSGAPLLVPVFDGRAGHPVLIDAAFRQSLRKLDPRRGLRGFFEDNRESVSRVEVASPYIIRDIDVWEDYIALFREVFGSASRAAAEQAAPEK